MKAAKDFKEKEELKKSDKGSTKSKGKTDIAELKSEVFAMQEDSKILSEPAVAKPVIQNSN